MERHANVMIATDGTEASVRAAAVARGLFGTEASYTFVHVEDTGTSATQPVVGVPGAGVAAPAMIEATPLESPDEVAERARAIAGRSAYESGMATAVAVGLVGDPAPTLAAEAAHRGVDVIVAPGDPAKGWFSKLFSSSTTAELERVATVPVLVVPTPG
jgi:nucleotide-binding universal stress UspA family protein